MSFGPLTSPTPIWGTFLDLQLDFKPYIQYPAEKFDQDSVLEMILDSACWWIQDYLCRPIAPTEFFMRFDGWSSWQGSYIMLPWFPVLRIVSLIEYWGNSGPHPLAEQTPTNQFGTGPSYGDADVYQLEPVAGKIIRTFPGLIQKPFFPGSRNIECTWIAGYSPIPPQLRMAALELGSYWYRNTQEDTRMATGRGFGTEEAANELWPAVPNRITTLLQSYEQQGIG